MPWNTQAATRNSARSSRAVEYKRANEEHFERSNTLFWMLYTVPVNERLGVMQHILSHVHADAGLRRILTDPDLLSAPPRGDGRMNIAKAAHAYAKKFFGVSIKTYVEQARTGSLNEFHPVTPEPIDHGPVPGLKEMRKIKCWHCRNDNCDQAQAEDHAHRLEEDLDRVNAFVQRTQAKVDAWNADPRNVMPDPLRPGALAVSAALEASFHIPLSALEADLHNPR